MRKKTMRSKARTTILVATALAATSVTVAGASSAGAAPERPGCTPTWRQVPVNSSIWATPLFLDIADTDPPVPSSVSALSGQDVRVFGGFGDWVPHTQRWTGTAIDAAPQQVPLAPGFEISFPIARSQSFSSPAEGWAVMQTDRSGQNRTYAARWHDGRWTIVPTAVSPDPLNYGTVVLDVASVSATDAWSVGSRYRAGVGIGIGPGDGPVIERWDGRSWSIVDNPATDFENSYLSGVTAVSPTDVWAVGRQTDLNGTSVPLIEHWDGGSWRVVPAPAGSRPAALYSVSAAGRDSVWAVGAQTKPGTNLAVPLVMHWNGTEWRVADLPDVGNARFNAIYAASPTDVWAIGQFPFSADAYFLHWNGRSWERVSPPGAASGEGLRDLYLDINGSGPNNVWAVGVHNTRSSLDGYQPIAARLTCERAR